MKILILTDRFYPDIGGIEMNSEILANYLYDSGCEIKIMTWSKSSSKNEFPYTIIREPNKIRMFKEHKWADLVFENNPCLKLSWPLILFRKPHLIALHTWIQRLDGKISIQDKVKNIWLKKAKAVIAVSKALRNGTFEEALVIENSYKEDLFKRIPEIPKIKDFVFLGRLVSDKGADMAIELIARLKENDSSLGRTTFKNLTIIGDGPEMNMLKEVVKTNNLEDNVFFEGALSGEELVKKLNEHKYILIPSRWKEPFGIVALEGIACGCLPIVSNEGGLPEAIGNTGIVFERNNFESLYNNVQDLLKNPLMEKILRSYFKSHLEEHTSKQVSEKYLKIIESIVHSYERN